jgi:hypothetical protein
VGGSTSGKAVISTNNSFETRRGTRKPPSERHAGQQENQGGCSSQLQRQYHRGPIIGRESHLLPYPKE